MTRQTMALFDAVTHPLSKVVHMSHNAVGRLTPVEIEGIRATRRIWVDESLHRRLDFTPTSVDFRTDFGELRLPFPNMWIEWVNHRGGQAVHMALQCFELTKGQKEGEFSWLGVPWFFLPATNTSGWGGLPAEYDQTFRIDFDADGNTLGVSGFQRSGDSITVITDRSPNSFSPDLSELIDICWNGLVAIGFMNCRNVTTERHERDNGKSQKQRRPRPPKLDYHTIILPSQRRGGGSGSGEPQGLMASHQVRGHFKTYTAESPLMGKHVGTYWWGWQVRGDKKNGTIISDYKVAATK